MHPLRLYRRGDWCLVWNFGRNQFQSDEINIIMGDLNAKVVHGKADYQYGIGEKNVDMVVCDKEKYYDMV